MINIGKCTTQQRAFFFILNELPLDILVEITDYLSIETCLNLAEVTPRLAAAVARSLRNTNCHIQGYWRERGERCDFFSYLADKWSHTGG
ncbi:F-box domain protein [Ancylostoma caninum]|uniref:F-box domain protein n=1 Tax=Ancylostoma caninum TaxID=29170 RepID=A0A368G7Q2_ANCCA|nr:F-box domain protein [Ancylostoma caninum]